MRTSTNNTFTIDGGSLSNAGSELDDSTTGDATNTVNLLGGNIKKKMELKQRKEKMIQEELQ